MVGSLRDAQRRGRGRVIGVKALLEALDLACRIGLEDVVLLGDALAVVNEAQGVLGGGSGREPYAARLREFIAEGLKVRVRWIRRGQNLAGIALDRRRLR